MTSIYEALSSVQNELHVPKDKSNDFSGFNYRNAEGILRAVKPILSAAGATLIMSDTIECIGGANYVCATVTFFFGKESIVSKGYAREAAQKKGTDIPQLTGMSSSYARKTALCGLFNVDDSSQDPDCMKQDGIEAQISQCESVSDLDALFFTFDAGDQTKYGSSLAKRKAEIEIKLAAQ